MTRERKWIVIIGALLLAAGALYRFSDRIPAVWPGDDSTGQQMLKRVEKYRALVDGRQSLENRVRSLRHQLSQAQSILLGGETPAVSGVEIQNIINQMAADEKIQIQTFRFLSPEKLDAPDPAGFIAVPVQFSFEPSISALTNLLYRIAVSKRCLRVTDILIRTKGNQTPPTLDVILTVAGYIPDRGAEKGAVDNR